MNTERMKARVTIAQGVANLFLALLLLIYALDGRVFTFDVMPWMFGLGCAWFALNGIGNFVTGYLGLKLAAMREPTP